MIIETERLILRDFQLSDAKDMFELNLDPDVIKYTGDDSFKSIKDASVFIQNYDAYDRFGYGRWTVIRKSDKAYLGWCGLKLNEHKDIDIGYRFKKQYWGNGYAFESANASVKYGFETLKLDRIIGRTASVNQASVKILQKIGMSFWKNDDCKGISGAIYYQIFNPK